MNDERLERTRDGQGDCPRGRHPSLATIRSAAKRGENRAVCDQSLFFQPKKNVSPPTISPKNAPLIPAENTLKS